MSTWMNSTPSLQKSVEIINGVEVTKFSLLLNRITQKMQQGSTNEKAFSKDEEEKLQLSLELDEKELKLLLDSSTFIIEQAAYHMIKPSILQGQLTEVLKLNEDKAAVFVNIWTSSAKGIVEQLRQKSVFASQLQDVRWSLNLQTASDAQSKQKLPKAVFQFGLKLDETKGKSKDNVTVEFSHGELYEFYKQLEVIQSRLDSLR